MTNEEMAEVAKRVAMEYIRLRGHRITASKVADLQGVAYIAGVQMAPKYKSDKGATFRTYIKRFMHYALMEYGRQQKTYINGSRHGAEHRRLMNIRVRPSRIRAELYPAAWDELVGAQVAGSRYNHVHEIDNKLEVEALVANVATPMQRECAEVKMNPHLSESEKATEAGVLRPTMHSHWSVFKTRCQRFYRERGIV